jgi:hypothetical protein
MGAPTPTRNFQVKRGATHTHSESELLGHHNGKPERMKIEEEEEEEEEEKKVA